MAQEAPSHSADDFVKLVSRGAEVEHAPDKIGGSTSTGLAGYTFHYTYTSGVFYRVSFKEDLAYFCLPDQVAGRWIAGLPYRCRELRPRQFLVTWLIPGRVGHVVLIFDLDTDTVDAAALMPGLFELFDSATFAKKYENGEHALWDMDPTVDPRPAFELE